MLRLETLPWVINDLARCGLGLFLAHLYLLRKGVLSFLFFFEKKNQKTFG